MDDSLAKMKSKDLNVEYINSLKIQNECGFTKIEIDGYLKLFRKYDPHKNGYIQFHELQQILQESGIKVYQQCKEKIFKEFEDRNTGKIDFQTCLYAQRVAIDHDRYIKQQEKENVSSEYVDAFVALGGGIDSSGYIRKDKILNILSDEFEMVFDMDDFLERVEVSNDMIDFDTFKKLFKISDDPRSLSRANSMLSLLSSRSRKTAKSSQSIDTVKVRMRDFERFLQKLESDEKDV